MTWELVEDHVLWNKSINPETGCQRYVFHGDNQVCYYDDKGLTHRLDGPAIIFNDSRNPQWFYKGDRVKCQSQEEFEKLIKLKAFW